MFVLVSLILVKIVFVILKLTLGIFHDNIVRIFIGGSGVLFVIEAAIFIWIKKYDDIL